MFDKNVLICTQFGEVQRKFGGTALECLPMATGPFPIDFITKTQSLVKYFETTSEAKNKFQNP